MISDKTPAVQPSQLANETLAALKRLCLERVPNRCGGFTSEDMQWQMKQPFTDIDEALSELERAKLIRFVGFDDHMSERACYKATENR